MALRAWKDSGAFERGALQVTNQKIYQLNELTIRVPHVPCIARLINYAIDFFSNLRLVGGVFSPQQRVHKVVGYFQVLEAY